LSSESYIRANDPSNFAEVIQVANRAGKFEDLVTFLKFARKNAREAQIESELLFAYAKTGRLADLEDFISSPNIAQVC
jgi:clathrin heavy chain